jgi:lysophospholipid acyltransferase 7
MDGKTTLDSFRPSGSKSYEQLPTLASFEKRSFLGLPFKDINLAAIVTVCLISGPFLIRMKSPCQKGVASSALSLMCIWLAAEGHTRNAAVVFLFVLIQTILLHSIRSIRRLRPIALIGLFTMTSVFRFVHDEWLNAQLSLVLMMQLLKLVGAAYDMAECRSPPVETKSEPSSDGKTKCTPICPDSFWLLLGYTYCHCGLVLGPFFRYRVYSDWLHSAPQLYRRNRIQSQTFALIRGKIGLVIFLFALMLLNQQLSPMNSLVIDSSSDRFEAKNCIDKWIANRQFALILNALLAFYLYRARLYFGFLLGEFVCMASSLGAYPTECASLPGHGPKFEATQSDKPVTIDYIAINTVDGLTAEMTGSIRQSIRNWNLPTQYWLARHVYSPMRGLPMLLRLYATLFISAVWHGVYSGYFLSFFVLPLLFWVESPWNKYVDQVHQRSFVVFNAFWLVKILLLSYFGVPFYLLRWFVSIQYWQAVNW